jgi:membrane protease YdiL (CAAX protease family)
MALLEEVVWRAYVSDALRERFGTRRALPIASVLYAAAHLPTLFTLRDPIAGLNPLVILAALGCGIVWTFLRLYTARFGAIVVSHAVFTFFYFSTMYSNFGF